MDLPAKWGKRDKNKFLKMKVMGGGEEELF